SAWTAAGCCAQYLLSAVLMAYHCVVEAALAGAADAAEATVWVGGTSTLNPAGTVAEICPVTGNWLPDAPDLTNEQLGSAVMPDSVCANAPCDAVASL